MRLDGYDKWLIAGADSHYGDVEDSHEAAQDEIVLGCMNGDDELSEFLTEDCSEINSEVTQILAKHHYGATDVTLDELTMIQKASPKDLVAALHLLKLMYDKFTVTVDKEIEYRLENY